MIVATAGHIDHGKTQLVRALTGVDCDRLPEEKSRGITIDLGFAYLRLAGKPTIGFVDVPGHERFVRNMLAGVCGIDFALVVVAADDGPMPQTLEHLQILDLLDVRRGVVAISKIDRVEPGRVAEVATQLRALLATTTLADAAILPVSALRGDGVAALRGLIENELNDVQEPREGDRLFRLAIDRTFSVAGSGTVVTGTVFDGEVRPGQMLTLSPSGLEARVRGLQVDGHPIERVAAGQRCALNLGGIPLARVVRGDWVLDSAVHSPTVRLDVRLTLLATESAPLAHGTFVHLHLGTTDVVARVGTVRGRSIEPGERTIVRLALERPVAAACGDRFILRDRSARRTLGGGIVIDPLAPQSTRRTPQRQAVLDAMADAKPWAALAQMLQIADHAVDIAQFGRAYALSPDAVRNHLQSVGARVLGRERPVAVPAARVASLQAAVLARLEAFHRAEPFAPGTDRDALHRSLAPELPPDAFAQALREMPGPRRPEMRGGLVCLAGSLDAQRAADEPVWQRIRPSLIAAGANPPRLSTLATDFRLKLPLLRDLFHRRRRGGEAFQLGEDCFFARETLAALAATAAELAGEQPGARFSAAQYRDAIGTGRTHAIRILELLDEVGVTVREGDTRCMRPNFTSTIGDAPPYRPVAGSPARAGSATGGRPETAVGDARRLSRRVGAPGADRRHPSQS